MKPIPAWMAVGLLAAAAAPGADGGPLARGIAAFDRRAEGHDGPRAKPGPVREAIAAFELALESDPGDLEARTRLLNALYYLGEYALEDRDDKLEVFERGRRIAEEGIDLLASDFEGDVRPSWRDEAALEALRKELEDRPRAPGLYYWGAVHWGLWGRHRGKLAAARQGVAGTIRDYGTIVVTLDPEYDDAGGHRVLGRLHHEAPRIPLVTGWVSRETAIRELTRAVELAPDNLVNRLYWIEALLEYAPERRQEAMTELRRLAAEEPRTGAVVEELQVLRDARDLLDRLGE